MAGKTQHVMDPRQYLMVELKETFREITERLSDPNIGGDDPEMICAHKIEFGLRRHFEYYEGKRTLIHWSIAPSECRCDNCQKVRERLKKRGYHLVITDKHDRDRRIPLKSTVEEEAKKQAEELVKTEFKKPTDSHWNVIDAAYPKTPDYEKQYHEFWKELVENEDGTLNKDHVMRELSDYSMIMRIAGTVYCHVTGNRISKVNTMADEIIGQADERVTEAVDEAVKEAKDDLVAKIVDHLSGYEHDPDDWLIARNIIEKVKELAGETGS